MIRIIHLTNFDLKFTSRKKKFEDITILDFNCNLSDMVRGETVYFIDTRGRNSIWSRFINKPCDSGNKIKILSL